MVTHPDDIAKANFLAGAHVGAFRDVSSYDVCELRAVYAAMPTSFEMDSKGDKANWRTGLAERLKALIQQQRRETVPGGWDPIKNCPMQVTLPPLEVGWRGRVAVWPGLTTGWAVSSRGQPTHCHYRSPCVESGPAPALLTTDPPPLTLCRVSRLTTASPCRVSRRPPLLVTLAAAAAHCSPPLTTPHHHHDPPPQDRLKRNPIYFFHCQAAMAARKEKFTFMQDKLAEKQARVAELEGGLIDEAKAERDAIFADSRNECVG